MPDTDELVELYRGRHLTMVSRHDWEFVTRNTARPAVAVVAVTDAGKVVLVEQPRPPVGRTVIELPAGLAGDVAGAEDESLLKAAKRELLEETGYVAEHWMELFRGYSSPGLTDESNVVFLARGLTRRGNGGGDPGERITVHEVPLTQVSSWIRERDVATDFKLFAGLYAAAEFLPGQSSRHA